jgi:hypothetical protein
LALCKENQLTVNTPHFPVGSDYKVTAHIRTKDKQLYCLHSLHHIIVPLASPHQGAMTCVRLRLKCDGTRAETRFCLWAKRTSPFKSAGASIQSTTGSRGVRIIGSNAGSIMFRGSVESTGYPLHSPVSPSLPLPCVTVCHHIGLHHVLTFASDMRFRLVGLDHSRVEGNKIFNRMWKAMSHHY